MVSQREAGAAGARGPGGRATRPRSLNYFIYPLSDLASREHATDRALRGYPFFVHATSPFFHPPQVTTTFFYGTLLYTIISLFSLRITAARDTAKCRCVR